MGIECGLVAISTPTLAWLKSVPDTVELWVHANSFYAPDPETTEGLRSMPNVPAVLVDAQESSLSEMHSARSQLIGSEGAPEQLASDFDRPSLDLDKQWSSLESIFRLLGSSGDQPCLAAIRGGLEVGPRLDFGPARFMDSDQVSKVSSALSTVTDEDFTSAAAEADQLRGSQYPNLLSSQIEDLLDAFHDLQRFYAAASQQSLCIAIVLM